MVRKLEVEFDQKLQERRFTDRKYTLTHSDETGQRYLFIGEDFAMERCSPLRDEVLGEWVSQREGSELHITCTLYAKSSALTIQQRYQKFKEHMPRAITAIVNGDKEEIISQKREEDRVYVHFLSDTNPGKEYYGTVAEYLKSK